jgi:hypothetical protein
MRILPYFLVIGLTATLSAQGLPSVSGSVTEDDSTYALELKNLRDSPLTAYLYVITKTSARTGRSSDTVSIFDAVLEPPDSYGGKYLNPGQTLSFPSCPKLDPGDRYSPRIAAAVFGDGHTEGEDWFVRRILERREIAMKEGKWAETLLHSALAQGTPISDVVDDVVQRGEARKAVAANIDALMDSRLVTDSLVSILDATKLGWVNVTSDPRRRLELALEHIQAINGRLKLSQPPLSGE